MLTDVAAGIAVDDGEGLVYVPGSLQGSLGVAVDACLMRERCCLTQVVKYSTWE